jgi:hypothetical protein
MASIDMRPHLERAQHKLPADAMQWRIHSPGSSPIIIAAAEPQVMLQLGIVAAADGVRGVVCELLRQLARQLPELLVCFDGCRNACVMWGDDLAAVAPVHLRLWRRKANTLFTIKTA